MALQISAFRMPSRAIKRLILYTFALVVFALLSVSGFFFRDDIKTRTHLYLSGEAADYFKTPFDAAAPTDYHAIDFLIHEARANQTRLLQKRSQTARIAASRYRERRGRHPPPGFEAWFRNALATDSVIVEDFYDRIYHDLTPFWAVEPKKLQDQASRREHVIRIRAGAMITPGGVKPEGRAGTPLWWELIGEIAAHLPDMDIPFNTMDEPRVLVPWEDIDRMVREEAKSRSKPRKADVVTQYNSLPAVDEGMGHLEVKWLGESKPTSGFWDIVRAGCSPDSPSHGVKAETSDFSTPPTLPYTWQSPAAYGGYVRNASGALDPCIQPHLRMLHSDFIEPRSVNTTRDLIPMFSAGKLAVNNDILLPSPAYLGDREHVNRIAQLLGRAWKAKEDALVFTGIGSGGRGPESPWQHFHRQRLVDMLNSTVVDDIEHRRRDRGATFDFPPLNIYNSERRRDSKLGAFLSRFARARFTLFSCGDAATLTGSPCDNIAPYVPPPPENPFAGPGAVSGAPAGYGLTLAHYNAKFLPIVDRERGEGGVSARFRATLLSTSVPLKATVYAEWHDDRLVPWLHYVPLDNSFRDLYAVLDFFTDGDAERDHRREGYLGKIGLGRTRRGDKAARWIAESGRAWAARVLRRDDMRLYVWRLLLEWARVCDENRARLGYVEDLA
ncbi:capsular associated protein [Plectosphaerella plurivora]|uniref:Capsular associated protein n=1 Tax=Plectosphaerella plurivora TaxID=936078 RepID=A0A9P8VGA1_9PEZI|nr:capsular associated protein [Plectosphaerella plurivora]